MSVIPVVLRLLVIVPLTLLCFAATFSAADIGFTGRFRCSPRWSAEAACWPSR